MKSKLWFFVLMILVSFSFYGQNNLSNDIERLMAISEYDDAYKLTQKLIKNPKITLDEKASYYIQYARILKSIYNTDSCFYYLDKAEKIYKHKQDKSKLFYILTIKAEVSRSLVKRNIATNYIYEAEKLLPENSNLEYKYYFYNRQIALLSEYYNNIPDSLEKIKKIGKLILDNHKEVKDKSLIVYTLNEIGYLDFHRNPSNAKKYFFKAHEVAEQTNSVLAYIDVSINLGRFFHHKESDFKTAIFYHNLGLEKAKEINNLYQILQCYYELKNCNVLDENFKNAYLYSDSLAIINAKIVESTTNKQYEILENKFLIENKEKELKEYKKNIYLLFILLISLFTGVFIMILYNKKIKSKNKELERLNIENKFLVSETNHRVNSNLQIINLLINELISKFKKKKHQRELESLLVKVDTIATLHRYLYQTKNNDLIHLNDYISELIFNFRDSFEKNDVKTDFNVEAIVLSADKAMFIGLLLTELIINSLKHAFSKDQEKTIYFDVKPNRNGMLFKYEDNGTMSEGKDIEPKLVLQICLQLEAKFKIETSKGFHFTLFTKK